MATPEIQRVYDLIKKYTFPGPYEAVPVGISTPRSWYIRDAQGAWLSPTNNQRDPLRFPDKSTAEKFIRHAGAVWAKVKLNERRFAMRDKAANIGDDPYVQAYELIQNDKSFSQFIDVKSVVDAIKSVQSQLKGLERFGSHYIEAPTLLEKKIRPVAVALADRAQQVVDQIDDIVNAAHRSGHRASLEADLKKLAAEVPELRQHLAPLLRDGE